MNQCIGLFGTCGGSKWRDIFIESYTKLGINFYNPQVEDWKPEDAEIEAEHLADDQIILFPITSETYATGSLSEIGFSVLNAIKLNERRDFIVMIDSKLDDSLQENETSYKESIRARAIVKQHLKKLALANLYIVESLDDMLEVSLVLHKSNKVRAKVEQYSSAQ